MLFRSLRVSLAGCVAVNTLKYNQIKDTIPLVDQAKTMENGLNTSATTFNDSLTKYNDTKSQYDDLMTKYNDAKNANNIDTANSFADQINNSIAPKLTDLANQTNSFYDSYQSKLNDYKSFMNTNANAFNTYLGYQAGFYDATGVHNTFLGYATGPNVTTSASGSYNTAIGYSALYSNTTASNNTAVGYQAGYTNSLGSRNTFIGYHHGNCKIDDLPLLFATSPSFSMLFGFAKYREVHTGDKHHYMAKETKGVRIQQMPSLSGTDRWHSDSNYVHSIRAALALVYDKEMGKVAEFEERL